MSELTIPLNTCKVSLYDNIFLSIITNNIVIGKVHNKGRELIFIENYYYILDINQIERLSEFFGKSIEQIAKKECIEKQNCLNNLIFESVTIDTTVTYHLHDSIKHPIIILGEKQLCHIIQGLRFMLQFTLYESHTSIEIFNVFVMQLSENYKKDKKNTLSNIEQWKSGKSLSQLQQALSNVLEQIGKQFSKEEEEAELCLIMCSMTTISAAQMLETILQNIDDAFNKLIPCNK